MKENRPVQDKNDTVGQAYESLLEKALYHSDDAVHHLNATGRELKDWLGSDLTLIKNELWQSFTEATDKTTLELLGLKQVAANAKYHTGGIIGLGTLVCSQCNAFLHFHKPGHVPPCAKCHGTHFHRLKNEI